MHIYPKEWYHMCVSHELKSGVKIIKAFINGEKVVDSEVKTSKTSVKFNDKWTLGFCKYYKNDGHTVLSPLTTILRGAISDFNLWSKALSDNEMVAFTKTCTRPGPESSVPEADLISWKEMKEEGKGTVVHSMEIPWVCKKRSVSTLIFEINTVFEDAMNWCNQLGGAVPFPKTQQTLSNSSPALMRTEMDS